MKNSTIAWTDHTFNPWEGCDKVSPGCANCYAWMRDKRWHGGVHWGKGAPRMRHGEAYWKQPLRWNDTAICDRCSAVYSIAAAAGHLGVCPQCELNQGILRRPRVFCASLADWLDEEVPIGWLTDLLFLIISTPNLDWLLLTKRPENYKDRIYAAGFHCLPNVWAGTTVENQEMADKRIPELLKIPARVRFLSCEPLLLPIDITRHLDGVVTHWSRDDYPIHWVICGAESGPKRRVMDIAWAANLMRQCSAAGVPFFMKQMSVNGKVTEDISQFPEALQVREFPVL